MRIFAILISILSAVPALAGTSMVIARQPDAPAQITKTLHGMPDALQAAWLQNRGAKTIIAYRVGWASVTGKERRFKEGSWVSVLSGINPGVTAEVPPQGVALDSRLDSMTFFISEVRFADGSSWKVKHSDLLQTGSTK